VPGSSLQITPSCNLPDKTVRGGKDKPPGKLAIVNLQKIGSTRCCLPHHRMLSNSIREGL